MLDNAKPPGSSANNCNYTNWSGQGTQILAMMVLLILPINYDLTAFTNSTKYL